MKWRSHKNYSEATAVEIDDEIKRIVDESYERAMTLLKENIQNLHDLSECLIEKENLTGAEVDEIIAAGDPDLWPRRETDCRGRSGSTGSSSIPISRPDMSAFPARLLAIASREDAEQELARIGVDPRGIGMMSHQDADPLRTLEQTPLPSGQHPQTGDDRPGGRCGGCPRHGGMQYRHHRRHPDGHG